MKLHATGMKLRLGLLSGSGRSVGCPGLGLLGERGGAGRPLLMGCEPAGCNWPPLRLARVCCEHESVVVVSPAVSRRSSIERGRSVMRCIGLDVHRDFCEVAIAEGGRARSAGRIATGAGDAGAVRAEPGADGPGRAGGDRQRAGDRADPRAACRARWCSRNAKEVRAISHARVKTDQIRRRGAGASCWPAGLLAGGVDRPTSAADAAPADLAPARRWCKRAHAGQERGARGAASQPHRAPAGQRSVRQAGPRVAGRAASCRSTSS